MGRPIYDAYPFSKDSSVRDTASNRNEDPRPSQETTEQIHAQLDAVILKLDDDLTSFFTPMTQAQTAQCRAARDRLRQVKIELSFWIDAWDGYPQQIRSFCRTNQEADATRGESFHTLGEWPTGGQWGSIREGLLSSGGFQTSASVEALTVGTLRRIILQQSLAGRNIAPGGSTEGNVMRDGIDAFLDSWVFEHNRTG
ncbi:uncharacterized protein I303_108026 [Kwoniella dejecticola CBS 10117]|uniref:Uncharacterized protein n=1 Tax=Kwoniella dejecticola CBS 10117 TaxID=1296121 RepID=A0A1A5ZWB7_9TREE|nr:uncharacterized protein I303_08017 [Kwoniella dejecticola CBS 10117]OBR82103.1 hypothetical protein I303_08017 [Kwoniella dejecticola CBS 10117]